MSIIKNNKNYGTRVILLSVTPTPALEYFYIEDVSGQSNTVSIMKSGSDAPTIEVFKSTDQKNWESMGSTDTTAITATVPANGKLYLKATADAWGLVTGYWGDLGDCNTITASGYHNVGGNIMSLLYGDDFKNQIEFPNESNGNFSKLFYNNAKLISAQSLKLPAMEMKRSSYRCMFQNCTSLSTAPELPATILAANDYDANSCYNQMFQGCTSLTTAPELPATRLDYDCYGSMFQGCTSLTIAPVLPATTLASYCYEGMFADCTSLTEAPVLPATTVAGGAYEVLFKGCTNLNKITTYVNGEQNFYIWVDGVAATGDFYNLGGATYESGANGIPEGWTVHTSL